MNGIEIQYLLGIFFTVVGLAELVMPTNPKYGAIVKFASGIILLFITLFLHRSFI